MSKNRMSVKEFRERGYLQELNRRFLHPLGLALEVVVEEGETERFGEVWDYRDDPEGLIFGDALLDESKALFINGEVMSRSPARRAALGYVVQPIEEDTDDRTS